MEHPDPATKWKNMRRMAYMSLYASLLFPLLLYVVPAEVGKTLADIATPFYLFTGAVVGAYMGFSTWGDKQ